MLFGLQIGRFLLVALAVCQVLSQPLLAQGQPAATPDHASKGVSTAVPPEEASPIIGLPSWPGQFRAYSLFMGAIASDDAFRQRELQTGERQILATRDIGKFMGIREDEEQEMRTILLDAYKDVRATDRRTALLSSERSLHHSPDLAAQLEPSGQQRLKIYRDAFSKLGLKLGGDSFTQFDKYLYNRAGAGNQGGQWISYESWLEAHPSAPVEALP